jgi:hypothetical protein
VHPFRLTESLRVYPRRAEAVKAMQLTGHGMAGGGWVERRLGGAAAGWSGGWVERRQYGPTGKRPDGNVGRRRRATSMEDNGGGG